jgi:ribonuclease PH
MIEDFTFGEHTLRLDCDVMQADGGTRTAAITGACVAAVDAFAWMAETARVSVSPVKQRVAAVSVGIVDGDVRLDLEYEEDVKAAVDMNIVMASAESFVEVQGTGEHGTFSRSQLNALLDLASKGIAELDGWQRRVLGVT